MKICLIQTTRWNINQPPLALPVLTGNLRSKGHTVYQLDLDVELFNYVEESDKRYWTDTSKETIWSDVDFISSLIAKYASFFNLKIDHIISLKPDMIGFSVQLWSKTATLWIAEQIKKIYPEVYIILGGPDVHKGVSEYLTPYNFIDALCLGEGDISFPNFINKINLSTRDCEPEPGIAFRNGVGKIVESTQLNPLPILDQIPFADFSDIDFSKYRVPNTIPMLMSRGCINRCSFCNESPLYKKFRYFSAERVYHEIRYHLTASNVEKPTWCHFQDSLINGNLNELERFADLLIRNPIHNLTYSGMMVARSDMTDQLVEKLAASGLVEVFWGIESGSKKTLQMMNKNINPADAERLIKKMYSCGVRNSLSMMVGHPGEAEEDFYKSLRLVRRIAPYTKSIAVTTTYYTENSELFKNADKYGIINPTGDWTSDNGTNTPFLREQRRLTMRALIGNKAHAMETNFDPYDTDSIYYCSTVTISEPKS